MRTDPGSDLSYLYLCKKVKGVLGIDLGGYKGKQMHRRLDGLRVKLGMDSFYTLARALERDTGVADHVRNVITINVSEFFRDPAQWALLQEDILPSFNPSGVFRAWSAGSSSGQEAYSLAICLEQAFGARYSVLATDIDLACLARGKEGLYSEQEVQGVPKHLAVEYFTGEQDGFRVKDDLKQRVTFRVHDLLVDPYPFGFHLVLCRNVLIYFTAQARDLVLRNLAASLAEEGVILTGSTEALLHPKKYGLIQICPFFYKKISRHKEGGNHV